MQITMALVLIVMATEHGLLSTIGNCMLVQRLSIYANDVVLFIKPKLQDLLAARELLRLFGTTSGLQINYRETSATVIRGGPQEEELVHDLI
jgi:hypothetical protein